MFAGVVPFKGRTQEQTFEKIKLGEFEMPKRMPATAQDLVKKLIVLQPENRLGATNIKELIDHEFFNGIDFTTISNEIAPMTMNLQLNVT